MAGKFGLRLIQGSTLFATLDCLQRVGEPSSNHMLTDVILFAGQSNCVGLADVKGLTGNLAGYRDPPANMLSIDVDKTWYPFSLNLKRTDKGPSFKKNFGSLPGHFGPEVSFGDELSRSIYKNENFGIFKCCTNASELEENWLRMSVQKGDSLLTRMVDKTQEKITSPQCKGGHCKVKALVWIQGEQDARSLNVSSRYLFNMETMVKMLRFQLDEPDLPVIVVQLPKTSMRVGAENVRNAQRRFVEKDRHAALIEGQDMRNKASLHYNASQQIDIGIQVAKKYANLLKSN